ncbi:MAG: hypothetical protein AAFX50_09670, partial [Acidobacteriota bacterium]
QLAGVLFRGALRRELVYTRYSVTTVANETLGIQAGSRGTLHAFTCAWSGAAVAPQNFHTDGDFEAYAAMIELIDEGLRRNDGEGLRHLERALGL